MEVEKLHEISPSERLSALEQIIQSTQQADGALLVQNPNRFFSAIKNCLQDAHWEVVEKSLQLLQIIIPEFGPDLDATVVTLLSTLVILLGHPKSIIRKNSLSTLGLYIRKSRNLQLVLNKLIQYSLQHNSWQVRQHALDHTIPLLQMDTSLQNDLGEMKKLLEQILLLLNDNSQQVSETAKRVSRELQHVIQDFQLVFKRLTFNQQEIFKDECGLVVPILQQNNNGEKEALLNQIQPISSNLYLNNFENQQNELLPVETQDINLNQVSSTKQSSFKPALNGQVFGFIPPEIIQQIQEGGKARVQAMSLLENLVNQLDGSNQNLRNEALQYIAAFVKFLNVILEDLNSRVTLSCLQILQDLVSLPGIASKAHLPQLLPNLLKKLGESKIQIRQSAQKVFRQLVKVIKPNVLFQTIKDGFQSDNWMLRKEILELTCIIILTTTPDYQFDFQSILPSLMPLLDDPKPKVRFIVLELLAIMMQRTGKDSIMNSVPNIYQEMVQTRLQNPQIAIINQEDALEFPVQKKIQQEFLESPETPYQEEIASLESSNTISFVNSTSQKKIEKQSPRKTFQEKRKEVQLTQSNVPFINQQNQLNQLNQDQSYPQIQQQLQRPIKVIPNKQNSQSVFNSYVNNQDNEQQNQGQYSSKNANPTKSRNLRINNEAQEQQWQQAQVNNENIYQEIPNSLKLLKQSDRIKSANQQATLIQQNLYNKNKRRVLSASQKPGKIQQVKNTMAISSRIQEESPEKQDKVYKSQNAETFKFQEVSKSRLGRRYEELNYVNITDLKPLNDPEQVLRKSIGDLRSNEWQFQFDALNCIRAIALHHYELLTQGTIHQLMVEILKLVDSPRSGLSKNALMTLDDFFTFLQKNMDPELDNIVEKLMRKACDSNAFLSDAAKDALLSLAKYCGENRVLAAIQPLINAKQPQVKANICKCCYVLINRLNEANGKKQLEKIVPILTNFVQDANMEVRDESKKALVLLQQEMNIRDFEHLLSRNLNENQVGRILKILESQSAQQQSTKEIKFQAQIPSQKKSRYNEEEESVSSTKKQQPSSSISFQPVQQLSVLTQSQQPRGLSRNQVTDTDIMTSSQKSFQQALLNSQSRQPKQPQQQSRNRVSTEGKTEGKIVEPQEFFTIPNLVDRIQTSDQKEKQQIIQNLAQIARENAQILPKTSKYQIWWDGILKSVSDGNLKVANFALEQLQLVLPLFSRQSLEPYVPNLLQSLSNGLCSQNLSLKQSAESTIRLLSASISPNIVIQNLINVSQKDNNKIKPFAVSRICEMLPDLKQQTIEKQVLPFFFKLMDEPQQRIHAIKLCHNLYNIIGTELVEFAPATKLQQILDILNLKD